MSKKDLTITCEVNDLEYEINLCDHSNEESILDELQNNIKELNEDKENEDDHDKIPDSFKIVDWQDVPANCQDIETALDLADYYGNSNYDLDVFEAAREAGIDFSNVDDSYQGEHKSDIDFAQDFAEQIGAIENTVRWPYTSIDWKDAASDLMMDYSESNGHYFRA